MHGLYDVALMPSGELASNNVRRVAGVRVMWSMELKLIISNVTRVRQ